MNGLSQLERGVCDSIAAAENELVDLLCLLIGFDTITHTAGSPRRDEEALQRLLATRLAGVGARIELTEPDARPHWGDPMVPEGFTFAGRPQLVARFPGSAGGRTLLLNGHVDVVDVEPRERWSSDPFVAEVRDGLVFGRGACDMKGGVAAMVFAAETLARLGVRLDGDLVVNTVTEEESTGAGGLVSARTLVADAASSRSRADSPCGSRVVARCCPGSPSRAGPDTRGSLPATTATAVL